MLWISQDLAAIFLDFLEEEFLRGFDIRILRVSISLGTKFQRNRLGRFWAPASLRKGVVISAISSVQNVWWDWSRLAYAGVTLFFNSSRPSSISSTGRSECMQMNRCQGGKASRLVPSNRLFPMVTVTNWSPDRSTLNSCNFAVFWRIELNLVALESWKIPLFHSIIFIGKSWGLKNHPWYLTRDPERLNHVWVISVKPWPVHEPENMHTTAEQL